MLISGDLYDRSMPSAQAVSLLDEMFTTLISRYHLPILAISGNHDSRGGWLTAAACLSRAGFIWRADFRCR